MNDVQVKASDLVYLIVQKQLLHEAINNQLMNERKVDDRLRQVYEHYQTEYDRLSNDIRNLIREISETI